MSQTRKESKTKHHIPQKPSPDKKDDLSEFRIITKNLVYVIGLSSSLANKEKLIKYEYFGQYGTIVKIVVNKNKAYNKNSPHGPTYSAYVTYSKPNEASIAILSLDETSIDDHLIRASFGTTKYCSYFLNGCECNNKDCVFLHYYADENEIIKRGELNVNKAIFANQHVIAIKIADIFNPEVKNKILGSKRVRTVFPPPYTLYKSKYVLENSPSYHNLNNNINNSINKNIYNNNKNIDKSVNEKNNNNGLIKKNDSEEYNKSKAKSNEKNQLINNNESTSNSSKEEIENNFSKNFLNKPLNARETSRFSFCKSNEDNNNNSVDIPIQIRYLLETKINLYNLSKYMNQNVIDYILENEYINSENDDQIKDWRNFIKENHQNYQINKPKDELENEVENINKFIMKKVWLYNKESKTKTQKKKI